MRSDVLQLSDLDRRDLAAWEQLGGAAVVANPFAEPAFVRPAARAWGVTDLGLLVVRKNGEWLAALPVRSVRSWRSVPGRCLAGWRHSYCYLGTPLVSAGDAETILAALISQGVKLHGSMALDWIDADGPLAEPLREALASEHRTIVLEDFERAALHRRERGDYLEQALSSRHRREYRRKLKRLERKVGELSLREDSQDAASYERFLDLERSGWKGETRTALACRPGHGEFFLEMCRAFAREGRLSLMSLASDGGVVAMRSDLIASDMSFVFKVAFDESFAQFSPGIQLDIANLQRFHQSELAWTDSCTDPANATLKRLWRARRRLRSVVATSRRASAAPEYAKWRAAAAALPVRRKLKALKA
jgi:CelD/BcsL family acetyltransferase involved in cellulose biosynthesis